ncbi:MAG: hypothetical protein WCF54_00145, partial [Terracidiphilus sp.]
MLKRILLVLLLGTAPVLAQTAAIQGHSFLGGTQAVTSGLKSSNYMQGIVPSATICVYNTGTTAPATIYANASGAPLSSCFTSNASISTDPGGWIFWAATNQGYDVVGSGGIPPNAYPDPIPLCIDCFPSAEFVYSGITLQTNGTDNTVQTKLNLLNGTNTTITSDSAGGVTINAAGGGSGTVSSGSGYALPRYGASAGTTVGPSNITTDATGNNLNVPGTLAAGNVTVPVV